MTLWLDWTAGRGGWLFKWWEGVGHSYPVVTGGGFNCPSLFYRGWASDQTSRTPGQTHGVNTNTKQIHSCAQRFCIKYANVLEMILQNASLLLQCDLNRMWRTEYMKMICVDKQLVQMQTSIIIHWSDHDGWGKGKRSWHLLDILQSLNQQNMSKYIKWGISQKV